MAILYWDFLSKGMLLFDKLLFTSLSLTSTFVCCILLCSISLSRSLKYNGNQWKKGEKASESVDKRTEIQQRRETEMKKMILTSELWLSCGVTLLDPCRMSVLLWLAVWRLTARLSSRPPSYSNYSHHPFPLTLNHQIPTSSSSRTTALKYNTITCVPMNVNIYVSVIKSQRADDEKQRTKSSQIQNPGKQEHCFHKSTNSKLREMMTNYICDLMSKYLLRRNMSRNENTPRLTAVNPIRTWRWLPRRRAHRDVGSRRLIDFSAKSK